MSGIDQDATTGDSADSTPSGFTPVDSDGDGRIDTVVGHLEGWGQATITDTDADTTPDLIRVDTNGDGFVDLVVHRDGDSYQIVQDADFDGDADADAVFSSAELRERFPDLWTLLQAGGDEPSEPTAGPSVVEGQVVGDPAAFGELWFEQAYNGYCVPSAVAQIYELYTGEDVSDTAFVDLANEAGAWGVSEGVPGMTTEGMITLLEAAGIPTEGPTYDHDLADLVAALQEGKPILVGVDSGEYWYGEAEDADLEVDHQVIVTGVSADGSVVYLSDTGTPDGNMLEVPAGIFMDAWADSSYEMVTVAQGVDEFRDGDSVTPMVDAMTQDGPATSTEVAPTTPQERSVTEAVLASVSRSAWIILPVMLGVTAAGVAFVKRSRS
ncbi:MAG: hypothetical protein ACQEWM_06880 [Actinomycetota bacterium]